MSTHVHLHAGGFYYWRARPCPGAFGDSEVLTGKGSVNQQVAVCEQAAAASLGVRGRMFWCRLRTKAHKFVTASCAAGASATAWSASFQQAATVKQQKKKGKFHTCLSLIKSNLNYTLFSSSEMHADLRTERTWECVSSRVRQPNHDWSKNGIME